MEVTAQAKFVKTAPRKVRLVAALVRGQDVNVALDQLLFSKKQAADIIVKLIKSAVANAEETYSLKKSNLFVKAIKVDGGPPLKRYMPRAQGRATPIMKHSSHVSIVLGERVPTEAPVKKAVVKDDILKIEELSAAAKGTDETDVTKAGKKKFTGVKKSDKGFVQKMFNRKSG